MTKSYDELCSVFALVDSPALIAEEEKVLWANTAARRLFIREGDDLRELSGDFEDLLREVCGGSSGELGTATLGGREWKVSVQPTEGAALWLFQVNEMQRIVQSVMQSALRGVAPVLDDMIGALHELAPYLEEQEDPFIQKELAVLLRCSHRFMRCVRSFCCLAAGSEDRRLPFQYTDLAEFFGELAVKEADILRDCGASLQTDFAIPDGTFGSLSRTAAETVLACLLSNAVHYGEPGQPIRLKLSFSGGKVLLQVENRGRPMSDDVLSTAFSRYLQPLSADAAPCGSGIGLAAVRQLAAQHGGSVMIQPREDGTAVTVTLSTERTDGEMLLRAQESSPLRQLDPSLTELSDLLPSETFDSRNVDV